MTYEELKALAKEHGYDLIKSTPKEKLLPCTCGYNRRSHLSGWDTKTNKHLDGLRCNRCGRQVMGVSERDTIKKWNEMVRSERDG